MEADGSLTALVDAVHTQQQNAAGGLGRPPSSVAPVTLAAQALEFLEGQGLSKSVGSKVLQALDSADYPAAEWLADTVRWLDSAENTAARPGPAPYDDAALMAKCAALAATAELAPRARTAEKL